MGPHCVKRAALPPGPGPDNIRMLATPRQTGLPIKGWHNQYSRALDYKKLPLKPFEEFHTLAVHSNGGSFVLGTEW
jgi:hypothetical protein